MGRFICFDTEDNSRELMLAGKSGFNKEVTQTAGLTDDGESFYARGKSGPGKFLRWIQERPETVVYAHNLQYDLGNLFGDRIDELDQTLVGGRLVRAVWHEVIFCDSFNIWPMAAKKLGAAFGLKKLEFDANSTEYVFRDVEIIAAAMRFAWDVCAVLGIERCPPTLGGLCVKIWKAWGGVNVHESSPICREALFGGRVELFKPRNETPEICYTDINSLYPSVMRQEFPAQLEPWGRDIPPFGIVQATVKVPESEICPLPFRDEMGRILYPWGTFRGTWTAPELRNAVEHGTKIERIHDCRGTAEGIRPYREFVERVYSMRLKSNSEAEKLFFKLLMNNLYGRLSISGEVGRTVHQTPENKTKGVPFGERVLVKYSMPLSEETNWSHGAYVTAYGRLALQGFMRTIGAPSLIYTDTDSCIFDCPGRSIPFPVGTDLGQMKLEGWGEHCETWAPKLYRFDGQYKAKGVPRNLAETFIKEGSAQFDLPFKMREAIAFFDRGNSKRLSVWRKVTRNWQTTYDKKELRGNRFFPCKVS